MEDRDGLVVMTTVGAVLAALYWGTLGVLNATGKLYGVKPDGFQMFLPFVLVVLYAMRGYKVFEGDHRSARNLMWLHGVGGVLAIVQIAMGMLPTFVIGLYAAKVAIHIIGGIPAAMLASRNS
jgi:hypothetical protein